MTNILDINQDQFVDQVIEKSKSVPVLVDFGHRGVGLANSSRRH